MRRWGAVGTALAAWLAACGGTGNQGSGIGAAGAPDGGGTTATAPDAGDVVDAGLPDAGDVDAGDLDGGTVADAGDVDAGTAADAGDVDAGTPDVDAGTPDAGIPPVKVTLHVGAPLDAPARIVDSSQGLASDVNDASLDLAGNLWAVNSSRLFLLRAGMGAVEKFDTSDGLKGEEILGVGGGLPGTAWVGYHGQGDADDDPEWMWHTGGVGKVVLNGADIDVTNLELSSPPGMYPQYPNGRHKLRTCYRAYGVKEGPHAGDAWFGCNHGTGLVQAPNDRILEHHHPNYCEWHEDTQSCTMHTGDVPAVAFTSDGDVWFGGAYGVMLLDYDQGTGRPTFWGDEPVRNLPLWEHPIDPNIYGSEDIVGLAVALDGSLWAASARSGLAHRLNDGTIEIFQEADGLPSNDLMDVAVDAQNRLWIATADRGVWRMDLTTGELHEAGGLPSSLGSRVVAEQTSSGRFIVVTVRGGVAIYPDAP